MREKRKILIVLGIVIFVILAAGIIKIIKNVDKKTAQLDEEIKQENPIESSEELEKVNVTGFHLVTYSQSSKTNSFIKSLEINAVNDANVKFVIGTIDEDGFVKLRKSFEIACKQGENTLDLLKERHLIKEGEYLMMDISGQDVLYMQKGETAKSLVQNESNKVSGEMIMQESDFVLPFKYTLEKAQEYNALVIGNDITTKDGGRGLAATDEAHDYYTLTKTRLENMFEKVNMKRINATEWEENKYTQTRQQWLAQNLKKADVSNLDLVIFQLGDNYHSTDDFEASVTELVDGIREYSPNAEMIWVGLWNINEKIFNHLPGICERLEIEFINISDLAVPEYQSLVSNASDTNLSALDEVFYPNNEAMQIISNRIIETLKFDF